MARIKLTVGEAVVRYLDNQYVSMEIDGKIVENKFVEGFFTIFGHGCVLGVGEALSMARHGIKVYQGRNEQGMAHVATAYAKTCDRRKIIPCMSSIGPGSVNMVTAAATATVNNIPLLLFMGDTFASAQPDPVLQQIEHPYNQGITSTDAFKAVTKFFAKITRPETIMTALSNAMRVLTDPADAGAAAIAISQDVQGETYEFDEEFFAKRVHHIRRAKPDAYEVERAAEAVKRSKRPLVIVGGGVRYSEAGNAIREFCEKHSIPFAETQAGKSVIPSSHRLNLGGIGVTGNSAANEIASKADLVIGIGTRFTDFTTSSKWLYAKSKIVTINVSPFQAKKLDATSVISDAREGITALDSAIGEYCSSYDGEIEKAKEKWDKEMQRLTSVRYGLGYVPEIRNGMDGVAEDFVKATGGTICQTAAIGIIRKTIPSDAIAVGAAGSLPGCLQRMWTTDSYGTYNMEYGYSCMGYEIAGALGSKMAMPDREAYAFCGDGSFNMLHGEMITALQEGIKINVLLFDNESFGCINNLQTGQGVDSLCTEARYRKGNEPIRSGEFMNIDYAACARAYGFVAYTAKTEEELEKALIDSLKQTKPTLIDIKVLPKSMTDGYGGWWNVGCSQNPRTEKQKEAKEERDERLSQARQY